MYIIARQPCALHEATATKLDTCFGSGDPNVTQHSPPPQPLPGIERPPSPTPPEKMEGARRTAPHAPQECTYLSVASADLAVSKTQASSLFCGRQSRFLLEISPPVPLLREQ